MVAENPAWFTGGRGGNLGGLFKASNFARNSSLCVLALSLSCSLVKVIRRNLSSSGSSLLMAVKEIFEKREKLLIIKISINANSQISPIGDYQFVTLLGGG